MTTRQQRAEAGFTLLEVMMVVAILAIATRIILPNLIEDVPDAMVQAEARKLAAKLSYLRTESRLQSQRYGIEIYAPDNEPHRYRVIMPREQQIVRETDPNYGDDVSNELRLTWYVLPEDVRFAGIHVGLRDRDTPRARQIFFDPRGRTAQKVLYLTHGSSPDLFYSVVVPPLAGVIETKEGRATFKTAVDSDF